MKKLMFFLSVLLLLILSACSQATSVNHESSAAASDDNLIFVEGGSFTNTNSNFYGSDIRVSDFYISKYEVTQKEWIEVMGSNPSQFKGDYLPVDTVSWYDAIEYCNLRSIQEGLEPYYHLNKNVIDSNNESEFDYIKWLVTVNEQANGYRLPTEFEWEYAASGGQLSQNYIYSGSDDLDEVSWHWRNAGDEHLSGDWNWPIIENNNSTTHEVGLKKPNELGLYDMSGNVREWCWDWYGELGSSHESGSLRVVKGGGWIGDINNNEIQARGKFEASGFGPDQGFRVVRSSMR